MLENIAHIYACTKWQNIFAKNGIFPKQYRFNSVFSLLTFQSSLFQISLLKGLLVFTNSHEFPWALFDSFYFPLAQSEIEIYKVYGMCAATYQLKY